MESLVNKRLFVAWLVLTAITLLYFWIDRSANSSGARTASTVVTVSAICLALVKVRIIMRRVHGSPTRAATIVPPHRLLDRAHGSRAAGLVLRRPVRRVICRTNERGARFRMSRRDVR